MGGQWWPALSVSCSVTNTVTLTTGGSLALEYDCTTFDPGEHGGDRELLVLWGVGAGVLHGAGGAARLGAGGDADVFGGADGGE